MKISFCALSLSLLLTPAVIAQQVYETTDDQGNTVFTDNPPTEEAKPVDLETPNISDSVEVRPYESAPAPGNNPVSTGGELPEDTPVYLGGNDDLRDEHYEKRRKEALRDLSRRTKRFGYLEVDTHYPRLSRRQPPADHPETVQWQDCCPLAAR